MHASQMSERERDLVLPSLNKLTVEEFSLAIARIRAPSLRHLVLGTDFGGNRRDVGWNTSFYGDAERTAETCLQATRMVQGFLTEHGDSLQSFELHSPLDWEYDYSVTFPGLRTLTIPHIDDSATVIDAPLLDFIYLSNPQHSTREWSLSSTCLTAKAITLSGPYLIYLLFMPESQSTTESLTVVLQPDELQSRPREILKLIQSLGDTPTKLFPCLKHLTLQFEVDPPLIGLRNWESYLFPSDSVPNSDSSESDSSSRRGSSYTPSESSFGSDNAEYYDDSDEWESTDEEEEQDARVLENRDEGEVRVDVEEEGKGEDMEGTKNGVVDDSVEYTYNW